MELLLGNHSWLEAVHGGVSLETEAHAAVAFCPARVPEV